MAHQIWAITLGGIPHWTDGTLTLPMIRGGRDPEATYTAPHSGPGGGPITVLTGPAAAGPGSRQPQIQTIASFQDLEKVYPQYKSASMNQLLIGLTNSGYVISPQFYKDLQDYLLATEQATQHPVAELTQLGGIFPAAARGDVTPPNVKTLDDRGDGDGRAAAAQAQAEAAIAAREEAQRQFQAQQDAIQRQWQEQQNELNRQAQLRLQRLGDLTGLVGQFAGFQSKARETLAGLQGDPYAFAAAKMGLAPSGVTPYQSFRGDLSQFAAQPLPQVSAEAPMSDIEAAIQRLQGQAAPQAPQTILGSAAEGGSVSGMGLQRVLVGERGPEVVEGSHFRVLPLTASGQAGYDPETLKPPLYSLYAGMGFGGIPGVRQMPGGGFGLWPGQSGVGRLGYQPSLIHDIGGGQTYYRTPTGELQGIASPEDFARFGFNYGDVFNVNSNEIGQYGHPTGAVLGARPTTPGNLDPYGRPSAFGPLSAPIIEPVTGAILPAPFRAAGVLHFLKLTNPTFYNLAISAYGRALSRPGDDTTRIGYNQASVEAEMAAALPTGPQHGLIGLR